MPHLLEVIVTHSGRDEVVSCHDTIASAFRSFAETADKYFGGPIRVDLTKAGKRRFGTLSKGPTTGITTIDKPVPGYAGHTYTDFDESPRATRIGNHKTHKTAVRQYQRVWNIFHKLHGHKTWLWLDPNRSI